MVKCGICGAHAALAKKAGAEQAIVPTNGALIRLAPGKAELVTHVEAGRLVVEWRYYRAA